MSTEYTPTEAQAKAREEGRAMGRNHGVQSLSIPVANGAMQSDGWLAFCQKCEALRDQAERTYDLSSRGWFGQGYDEGFEAATKPKQTCDIDVYEAAFSQALEAFAMGATWNETKAGLLASWSHLTTDDLHDLRYEVRSEGIEQGIEREDTDPSWYRIGAEV